MLPSTRSHRNEKGCCAESTISITILYIDVASLISVLIWHTIAMQEYTGKSNRSQIVSPNCIQKAMHAVKANLPPRQFCLHKVLLLEIAAVCQSQLTTLLTQDFRKAGRPTPSPC